jgi:hypothetical protein
MLASCWVFVEEKPMRLSEFIFYANAILEGFQEYIRFSERIKSLFMLLNKLLPYRDIVICFTLKQLNNEGYPRVFNYNIDSTVALDGRV